MTEIIFRIGRSISRKLPFLHKSLVSLEELFYYICYKLHLSEQYALTHIKDELGRDFTMYISARITSLYTNPTDIAYQHKLASVIQEGMTVYDLGADIGYFTLFFSDLVGETGKVLAFEPNVQSYQRLLSNIEMNQKTNIILYPLAVSEHDGVSHFNVSVIDRASALANPTITTILKEPVYRWTSKVLEVETVTVDTWVLEKANPVPQLVKIDVEGAEIMVIRGMERVIARYKPILAISLHSISIAEQVISILQQTYDIRSFNSASGCAKILPAGKLSEYNITTGHENIICTPK